jgi:hypothetical protein
MAKLQKQPEPETPKAQTKEAQEVLSGSIDDRMKALREDHIRMGARAPGDRYVPRR